MNDKLKLYLFHSYYGECRCDLFVPFGYKNIIRGIRSVLVKNLSFGSSDGLLELWNKNNNCQFIYFDNKSNNWMMWVEENTAVPKRFDIDYWLDKMRDPIS